MEGQVWMVACIVAASATISSFELAKMLARRLVEKDVEGSGSVTVGLSVATGLGVFLLGYLESRVYGFWVLWVCMTSLAVLLPADMNDRVGRALIVTFTGAYCGGGWLAIWYLYEWGPKAQALLFMMTIVILSDSAAYFGGTKWGKTKMAPTLSPAKSWEGFGCGIVASVVGALICNEILDGTFGDSLLVVAMGVCGASAGVVGDLVESSLKRYSGVKDSGSILPGHGGMLDRADASLFASPVILAFLRNFIESV